MLCREAASLPAPSQTAGPPNKRTLRRKQRVRVTCFGFKLKSCSSSCNIIKRSRRLVYKVKRCKKNSSNAQTFIADRCWSATATVAWRSGRARAGGGGLAKDHAARPGSEVDCDWLPLLPVRAKTCRTPTIHFRVLVIMFSCASFFWGG